MDGERRDLRLPEVGRGDAEKAVGTPVRAARHAVEVPGSGSDDVDAVVPRRVTHASIDREKGIVDNLDVGRMIRVGDAGVAKDYRNYDDQQ